METDRMKALREKMNLEGKDWIAEVVNFTKVGSITTKFNSREHKLENVLHKIELDLMSNLNENLGLPIAVVIKPIGLRIADTI